MRARMCHKMKPTVQSARCCYTSSWHSAAGPKFGNIRPIAHPNREKLYMRRHHLGRRNVSPALTVLTLRINPLLESGQVLVAAAAATAPADQRGALRWRWQMRTGRGGPPPQGNESGAPFVWCNCWEALLQGPQGRIPEQGGAKNLSGAAGPLEAPGSSTWFLPPIFLQISTA